MKSLWKTLSLWKSLSPTAQKIMENKAMEVLRKKLTSHDAIIAASLMRIHGDGPFATVAMKGLFQPFGGIE